MPRKCSICEHEQKAEINRLLLEGEPYRKVSIRFGTSVGALQRHKEHLPIKMVTAQAAVETVVADSLLDQVKALLVKANSILTQAEQAGDLRTALQGVREARSCLELLARLQGELQQEGTINITFIPKWLEIRTIIMQILEPYPDIRIKLAEALGQQEAEHATVT